MTHYFFPIFPISHSQLISFLVSKGLIPYWWKSSIALYFLKSIAYPTGKKKHTKDDERIWKNASWSIMHFYKLCLSDLLVFFLAESWMNRALQVTHAQIHFFSGVEFHALKKQGYFFSVRSYEFSKFCVGTSVSVPSIQWTLSQQDLNCPLLPKTT